MRALDEVEVARAGSVELGLGREDLGFVLFEQPIAGAVREPVAVVRQRVAPATAVELEQATDEAEPAADLGGARGGLALGAGEQRVGAVEVAGLPAVLREGGEVLRGGIREGDAPVRGAGLRVAARMKRAVRAQGGDGGPTRGPDDPDAPGPRQCPAPAGPSPAAIPAPPAATGSCCCGQ